MYIYTHIYIYICHIQQKFDHSFLYLPTPLKDGCTSTFPYSQLEKSLPPKVLEKYNELQCHVVLEKAGIQNLGYVIVMLMMIMMIIIMICCPIRYESNEEKNKTQQFVLISHFLFSHCTFFYLLF